MKGCSFILAAGGTESASASMEPMEQPGEKTIGESSLYIRMQGNRDRSLIIILPLMEIISSEVSADGFTKQNKWSKC